MGPGHGNHLHHFHDTDRSFFHFLPERPVHLTDLFPESDHREGRYRCHQKYEQQDGAVLYRRDGKHYRDVHQYVYDTDKKLG